MKGGKGADEAKRTLEWRVLGFWLNRYMKPQPIWVVSASQPMASKILSINSKLHSGRCRSLFFDAHNVRDWNLDWLSSHEQWYCLYVQLSLILNPGSRILLPTSFFFKEKPQCFVFMMIRQIWVFVMTERCICSYIYQTTLYISRETSKSVTCTSCIRKFIFAKSVDHDRSIVYSCHEARHTLYLRQQISNPKKNCYEQIWNIRHRRLSLC